MPRLPSPCAYPLTSNQSSFPAPRGSTSSPSDHPPHESAYACTSRSPRPLSASPGGWANGAGTYGLLSHTPTRSRPSLNCADEDLVTALSAMTGRRVRGWWEEYREHLPAALVDLAELEHHATGLRVALAMHIPALLQTTDHARALFRAVVPPMRQHEIEHRLTHRIKRQDLLHRDNPPSYSAIIHESALRMGFGGAEVTRAQLKHLLDMSELPNVTVRVIPFGAEFYPSTGQSFDYVQGPVPQLDTVQLDTHHGGCGFLDAEAQLGKYRAVLEHMESCALDNTASRDFIQNLTREM